MAQANQKITLNVGRAIPFDKLVLSRQNVRKIKAGVSIEDLEEDITRRGLVSSFTVRAELDAKGNETGFYRIPARGLRYRALELLVSRKRLAKTAGIPCVVSRGIRLRWRTPSPRISKAPTFTRSTITALSRPCTNRDLAMVRPKMTFRPFLPF